MNQNVASPALPTFADSWRQLFERALFERDPAVLPRRLQDAKNAILDRIEDSLRSASASERRLLMTALNTIGELQRLANVDDLQQASVAETFGHAA
jgi:hypothetical protein